MPQLARYRFLRTLWPQVIDKWYDGIATIPAARRVLEAGASHVDLRQVARAVAYETVFAMLYHVGADEEATDHSPSWALAEISPTGAATGRYLDGLAEDLLALDPSGRQGQDLWT